MHDFHLNTKQSNFRKKKMLPFENWTHHFLRSHKWKRMWFRPSALFLLLLICRIVIECGSSREWIAVLLLLLRERCWSRPPKLNETPNSRLVIATLLTKKQQPLPKTNCRPRVKCVYCVTWLDSEPWNIYTLGKQIFATTKKCAFHACCVYGSRFSLLYDSTANEYVWDSREY